MKQHNLFLMCGIAGSGKSTWISEHIKEHDVVISRDQIRFEMVAENEKYFSHEKAVFAHFVEMIQNNLNDDRVDDIYCDATHITKASRDKLLNALDLTNAKQIIVVVVRPSLTETLRRNELRTGREHVPRSVIRRMWYQFERPEEDENRIFDTIYVEVPVYE